MNEVNEMLDNIGLERLVHGSMEEYIRRLVNTGMSYFSACNIYFDYAAEKDFDGLERYLQIREWRYHDGVD